MVENKPKESRRKFFQELASSIAALIFLAGAILLQTFGREFVEFYEQAVSPGLTTLRICWYAIIAVLVVMIFRLVMLTRRRALSPSVIAWILVLAITILLYTDSAFTFVRY
jgi:hypothetical protein